MYAGSDKAPAATNIVKDKDELKLGENIEIRCVPFLSSNQRGTPDPNIILRALHTPCHTQDSTCFYAHDIKTGEKGVFTGYVLGT